MIEFKFNYEDEWTEMRNLKFITENSISFKNTKIRINYIIYSSRTLEFIKEFKKEKTWNNLLK